MRAPWKLIPASGRPYVALLLLHLICVVPFPWENSSTLDAVLHVSPDLVFVLGIGLLLSLSCPWKGVAAGITAGALLLVPAYRVGWSVVPAFLEKEFDLYNDILLIDSLEHLLAHEFSSTQLDLIRYGSIFAVLLCWWLLQRLMLCVLGGRSPSPAWQGGLLLALLLILSTSWVAPSGSALAKERLFTTSMYGNALEEGRKIVNAQMWRYREHWDERVKTSLGRAQAIDHAKPETFALLNHADVYLVFLESYGRIALDDPRATTLPADLQAIQGDLQSKGWVAGSGYAFPSISGGQSSLAHAEFLSGVLVEWRRISDLLLGSSIHPLPKKLAKSGYHTVNVQPAMTRDWPASRKFYGFEEDLFSDQLSYKGHIYPWGKMPDQYTLARILDQVVKPAKQPLFVQFIGVTSHLPFAEIPGYVDDWAQAATSETYRGPPKKIYDTTFGNYRGHPQAFEAYADSIRYCLRSTFEFAKRLERPSLVIVLGDHQPPGLEADGEKSFDVPFHLLTNRIELAALFASWGLAPGLVPAKDFKSFSFSEFLYKFLEATSRARN